MCYKEMALCCVSAYGYIFYFFILSYGTCSMVNYTVYTPRTDLREIVINITSTDEPLATTKREPDIIADFLQIVEEYERNKFNCTPGTQFNLGEGVIQQYGINKFKQQALVAVNRANFLTRLWMSAPREVLDSEYLLYTQVRNIVEGDPLIFAGGNCYDHAEYKDYYLFCPYAYRTEDGSINVKDLSVEYDYLGNDSEWFYEARMRAGKIKNFNFTVGKYINTTLSFVVLYDIST